ncbi:hypothetical protein A3C09_01720 [Candidatus Uhrbacteria bacterium RIFCSPHIGHO2_02_FULL_47_44]|uniref:Methyltransferase domain-containing protein n=1 Tax=Candidatus Uhrbacteria bacterium RIFCSPLOWO2_02_FULL_48_18 TaxID=1802408 RepID=A0A1F7V7I9_9BACT|nr:MAG: hypothetical protein A2839_04325 [Candidatus Uhrbacteria bacterium RIFCSPHIGHO2_01_FULL_47_10]OGL70989.1 MAG: hypothetical protein A3C09_01720 [Candidatus Uhrbacteria bacterium RIFCSPHIGHO2_02_FULL_47_44]OGL77753.1 MAG: hypothetical protein A3E97_00175 [Candidatus Uhrbacteria bacterium RIFCSPHIGHO2_12_FULL_47_12]OGL80515.1 MAG: hypothetical protein A3B20_03870 [Candidatus Uhrbacteria bacterium RIFCSPLOWO2_01_FULL_47_17]OGL86375.1 MAG: hypothetical protein A3I41_02350 [Candidatus Uhrbact
MRDYDYPAKNTVRDAWMRFLPEFFQDTQAHGLYLPGHQNLEFPCYEQKRLSKDRLIGIEHDPSRFAAVKRKANGIRLIHGNVRDAVCEIEQQHIPRLRFANLDFEGLYSRLISEILSLFRVFPSTSGGYLCVTSFSSRDEETLLQGMIHTSKFYSGRAERTEFMSDYGRMVNRYVALKHILKDPRASDHSHLTRELGFLWWMTLVMGVMQFPGDTYGIIDEAYLTELDAILERIDERSRARSEGTLDFHLVYDTELATRMCAHTSCLWPSGFQHFIYYTAPGLPMHVWMLKIDFINTKKKPSHQDVLEQVWQFATRTPLIYVDKMGTAHSLV